MLGVAGGKPGLGPTADAEMMNSRVFQGVCRSVESLSLEPGILLGSGQKAHLTGLLREL